MKQEVPILRGGVDFAPAVVRTRLVGKTIGRGRIHLVAGVVGVVVAVVVAAAAAAVEGIQVGNFEVGKGIDRLWVPVPGFVPGSGPVPAPAVDVWV